MWGADATLDDATLAAAMWGSIPPPRKDPRLAIKTDDRNTPKPWSLRNVTSGAATANRSRAHLHTDDASQLRSTSSVLATFEAPVMVGKSNDVSRATLRMQVISVSDA
jgi:hypothetical protein